MTNTDFKNPYNRGSFITIVDVLVGSEEEVFKFHKELLYEISPVFRAALNGQFRESHSQTIRFSEEFAHVFEHFQLWVYSGSIIFAHESYRDVPWHTLYDLYKFGDKHGIPKLQNTVIDVFIDKGQLLHQDSELTDPYGPLDRIYEDLPGESLLNELFVDLMTYDTELMDGNWFANKDSYPKEVLLKLIESLYKVNIGKKAKHMDVTKMRSLYYLEPSENVWY